MRFTAVERSGLALVLLLFGMMLAMYITEQVTHQPASPVWQVPFGGIALYTGVHVIRFRQALADGYNEGVRCYSWIGRTSDPYIAPVLYVFPGILFIMFGIFMMARGLLALL